MKVIVAGPVNNPILLNTDKATAVLITNNEGRPNVIYKMLADGKGWLRLTKGEDANFDDAVKQLGFSI